MALSTVAISAEPLRLGQRSSKVAAFIGIFLLWLILAAFVYRHTQSNFLRAESGWYLFLSHSDPVVRHNAEEDVWSTSLNGHYAPLAFLAEFETARLIGTQGWFWKWRQITVLALLATTLFLFARNAGSVLRLPRARASLSALALTAILIFQGEMRDFIAWPFMIMQLGWLLCSTISLLSLVQMARDPAKSLSPWLAVGSAYASLHFLGLGLATVAATAATLIGLWLGTRPRATSVSSKLAVPLLGMLTLTTIHGFLMLKFSRAEASGSSPTRFLEAVGFIPNFTLATLRGLFSVDQPTPPPDQSTPDVFYGVVILVGLGFLVISAFFRFRKIPSPTNQIRFVLRTFASVSFLAIIALISIRLWREASPHGFAEYLRGSRYLIPSSFTLAGLVAELLLGLAAAPILPGILMNAGLAVYSVIGNLNYAANVYPKLEPRSMISHDQTWHSIVALARDCRGADLAIPNVPLGVLTQEFDDWDLKVFEPLLRDDLQTPPGTNLQFIAWPGSANELPGEYRNLPSLDEVRKQLRLEIQK